MIPFYNYLIISTICLSICYGLYLILFRKESGFIYLRAFLVGSMLLSLLLPLTPLRVETGILGQGDNRSELVSEINDSELAAEKEVIHGGEHPDREVSRLPFNTILLLILMT
jgi:hypothetical protein